jgi:hypothetical protein
MRAGCAVTPALFISLLTLGIPDDARAQFRKGIGRTTADATLHRTRPPRVVLTGTAVKIEVVSQTNNRENIAQRFATTFETKLFGNDLRLRSEQARPDTVIFCTISRIETTQTAGQRQVTVHKQVGTKQVYNSKKKVYESEPDYQLVNETQTFTTVRGDLAVSVQVRDRKSGATIDSQTFTPNYNREFIAGTTPADTSQVEQWLIDGGVDQAVQRLTPTRETVKVMLARPNDAIDEINRLGQAGLWQRMLEQLELTKPLSDREKEAYRLYNIGVANEAVAYASEDLATSRKLLEQASSFYGKALEMKPDEKYFREPQLRISDGIAAYAELDRQRAIIADAEAKAAATVAAAAAAESSDATGARSLTNTPPGALTNKDVIDLVSSGLDEKNLLAAIKEAKTVAFDLSPGGLKNLLSAKVSNVIISALRTRQNAPPKTGGRRPAGAGTGAGTGTGTTTPSKPAAPATGKSTSFARPPATDVAIA